MSYMNYTELPSYQFKFQQHANNFMLSACLKNNKLAILLHDYVDNVIYFKEYDQKNIDGEIHKKMDVHDVYNAFLASKGEEVGKEGTGKPRYLGKYLFGTVVERDQMPCYKIQQLGKVTAYLNILDAKTKKPTTYESILHLTKASNMTPTDMQIHRLFKQQRQEMEQLEKQIEKLGTEKRKMEEAAKEEEDRRRAKEEEESISKRFSDLLKSKFSSQPKFSNYPKFSNQREQKSEPSLLQKCCWIFLLIVVVGIVLVNNFKAK